MIGGKKRVVTYVGEDREFYDGIHHYINSYVKIDERYKELYEIVQEKPDSLDISNVLNKENSQHAIFIDFLSIEDEGITNFMKELVYLKKSDVYKSLTVLGIFTDKEFCYKYRHLFAYGVSLGTIQGCSIPDFIRDSFEIAFNDRVLPVYAMAKDIDANIDIYFPSLISQMNDKSFTIDSDWDVEDKQIRTSLPMFKDLEAREFTILKSFKSSLDGPLFYSYQIKYPLAGPWDLESNELLNKDTLGTWLDLKQERFKESVSIKVFTRDVDMIFSLMKEQSLSEQLSFCISSNLVIEDFLSELECRKYSLVFLDLTEEGACEDSLYGYLSELTDILKNQRSVNRPILILGGCKSKSEALKTLYGYDEIMSLPSSLRPETVMMLANRYREFGGKKIRKNLGMFKVSASERNIEVFEKFKLLSLTERELTFLSDRVIPYYTVIRLDFGFSVYATLVPSGEEENRQKNRYVYRALIHSVEEVELEKIRKLVNQLIFSRVDDLCPETVKKALAQAPKQDLDVVGDVVGDVVEDTIEENVAKRVVNVERRFSDKIKSKL